MTTIKDFSYDHIEDKELGILTIVRDLKRVQVVKDRFEHYYLRSTSSPKRIMPNKGNYFLSYRVLNENVILLEDMEEGIVIFRHNKKTFTTLFEKGKRFQYINAIGDTVFFTNKSDPQPIGYIYNSSEKRFFKIGNQECFHIYLSENECQIQVEGKFIPFDTDLVILGH